MIQWEYLIAEPYINTAAGVGEEKYLMNMGNQGWELVTVMEVRRAAGVRYYFKRPIPETENKTVFVPCDEHDPERTGAYTSNDGQSLCYVKEKQL